MGISSGGCGIVAGKGKTATAKLAEEGQAFGRRRLRDLLFIGVGAACVFVLMALLTYTILAAFALGTYGQ